MAGGIQEVRDRSIYIVIVFGHGMERLRSWRAAEQSIAWWRRWTQDVHCVRVKLRSRDTKISREQQHLLDWHDVNNWLYRLRSEGAL